MGDLMILLVCCATATPVARTCMHPTLCLCVPPCMHVQLPHTHRYLDLFSSVFQDGKFFEGKPPGLQGKARAVHRYGQDHRGF